VEHELSSGMLTILVKTTASTNSNTSVKTIANTNTNTFVQYFSLFITFGNVHVLHGHLLIKSTERLLSRNGSITIVYNDIMLMSKQYLVDRRPLLLFQAW